MKLNTILYTPRTVKQSMILDRYLQIIDQIRTLHGEEYDPQKVDEIEFFIPPNFYQPEEEYHEYIDIDYHDVERQVEDISGKKVVTQKFVVNKRKKNIRDKRVTPFIELANDWNGILNSIVKIGDIDMETKQIIKEYNTYYNKTTIDWIHFTCRPAPDCTYPEFIKQAKKAFKKKWITEYTLVFEQKGKEKENLGIGFHLHALIKIPYDKPWSDCKQEMYNTFKHIAKPGLGSYAQAIKTSDDYEKVLKYFSEKNTEEKNDILPHDKIWRQNMNLKEIYNSDFI